MSKKKKIIIPSILKVDKDTLSDSYGKFIAEPFESGYGNTLGNSLRRILLSSLEGNAITSVKINGLPHEYSVIDGVKEDVMSILLNLKLVRFSSNVETYEEQVLRLHKEQEGPVFAGDIETNSILNIVNKDLVIANLDVNGKLDMEIYVGRGRGYISADEQDKTNFSIGRIAVDSIFSPVVRVNNQVENFRVGNKTDYDRLILEIWTDGTISPSDALSYSAEILKDSVDIFVDERNENKEFLTKYVKEDNLQEKPLKKDNEKNSKDALLDKSVDVIELSIRSANCLRTAKINTIRELISKKETELLTYKNFGRKSLDEIKEKLHKIGLELSNE